MKKKRTDIRRLTVCAMLAALGVILLWLGALTEVLDISMAVLASLCCVFAVIEYGKSAPWLVFAVTGLLALILLPQKTTAIMYVFFFGYYPILKERFERLPRVMAWICKEGVFNAALIVLLIASRWLLMGAATEPMWYYVTLFLCAEAVFPLYDIALSRLISFYIYKLRSRFRIGK